LVVAVDSSTVDRVRRQPSYRATIVCLRIFLIGFALLFLLAIPLALGAPPATVAPLLVTAFGTAFIGFFGTLPGMVMMQRTMSKDAQKEGGWQIQGRGRFFKLLLTDLFTGVRTSPDAK
jgi:O-antigen/teichoic acid export membrane protein